METLRLIAAILFANFQRTHWDNPKDATKAIIIANNYLSQLLHDLNIEKKAKEEPTLSKGVAEIKTLLLTTSYQSLVRYDVPAGKTLYVSKVEMYCDDHYDVVQWEFSVNSKPIELNDNTKWTNIIIPVAFTMTFDGLLEVQGGKYIEVKAKDDGTGANAWADITGTVK